jgi:CRP/FNR family transcriptional regulator, cyclic AMP receptor protein
MLRSAIVVILPYGVTSNHGNGRDARRRRTSASTVGLLSVAPELADFLTPEERLHAERVLLPVVSVSGKVDVSALLKRNDAFAAFVVDGMVLREIRIGEQPTLRIFGPGELVATGGAPNAMLVVESECRVVDVTHLAMIGLEFLAGAHRWPRLVAGLYARTADGAERIATQLAISQLPRVQDRLLAMLWLLAESWGRVTPAGIALSLSLTHEALGALIGARRPTVTLALRDLADRGAAVQQDGRWLLLQAPAEPPPADTRLEPPQILAETNSPWTEPDAQPLYERAGAAPGSEAAHEMLRENLARLREDHRRSTEQHQAIVESMIAAREHNVDIRRRIRSQLDEELPPPILKAADLRATDG